MSCADCAQAGTDCEGCDELPITDEDVQRLRELRAQDVRNQFEAGFQDALGRLEQTTRQAIEQLGSDSDVSYRFARTLTSIQNEWDNFRGNPDFWLDSSAMQKFANAIQLAAESIEAEAISTADTSWLGDWRSFTEALARQAEVIGTSLGNAVPAVWSGAQVLVWGAVALVALYYFGPALGLMAKRRAGA